MMTSLNVICYSPAKISVQNGPSRLKTPSPKTISNDNLVLVRKLLSTDELEGGQDQTSPIKNAKLVPTAQFSIVELKSNENPKDIELVASATQIILSSPLVENGALSSQPLRENLAEIASLFPLANAVEIAPPFVIIRFDALPSKPWPLSIGGMPVWFTTDSNDFGPQRGNIGRGPEILGDLDWRWKAITHEDVSNVLNILCEEQNLDVREISWFGGWWRIHIDDEYPKKHPRLIAKCLVFYGKPDENIKVAAHIVIPNDNQTDDTCYVTNMGTLRPGILVQDKDGNYFITGASQGFNKDGLVWHPKPTADGQVIGTVIENLPDMNIAIIRLHDNISYTNELFDGENATVARGFRAVNLYENITMNSPVTGSCVGIVHGIVEHVDNKGNHSKGMWASMESGLDGNIPREGCDGTPILAQDDSATVGFFRYQGNGFSLATSVIQLKTAGSRVAECD